MPEQTLSNARIDQLPKGGFIEPEDELVFRSKNRGVTYSIKAKDLIPVTDSNFQWVSANEYDEDDVVTYGGSWWQSQQDENEAIIPGTNEDYWVEIPKSVASGLSWWQAGAYVEENVIVVSDHQDQARLYLLLDEARPFNSADIATEESEGKWQAITEFLQELFIATGAVMILNTKNFRDVRFRIVDPIDANCEFQLDASPSRITLGFNCLTDVQILFPENFFMSDAQWQIDDVPKTWTCPEDGDWLLQAELIDTKYFVKIVGPYV